MKIDDIAEHFGCSKKTLYQLYRSKKMLIVDVLAFRNQIILDVAKQSKEKSSNAIENYIRFSTALSVQFDYYQQRKNILQLMRYYPKICSENMIELSDIGIFVVEEILKRGEEECLFEFLNVESAAKIFCHNFLNLISGNPYFPQISVDDEMSFKVYVHDSFHYALKGFLSEKGREELINEKAKIHLILSEYNNFDFMENYQPN